MYIKTLDFSTLQLTVPHDIFKGKRHAIDILTSLSSKVQDNQSKCHLKKTTFREMLDFLIDMICLGIGHLHVGKKATLLASIVLLTLLVCFFMHKSVLDSNLLSK